MFNNSKTALVTGGCGFVGRHMVRRLLKEGYELWIVDDLSIGLHTDEWLPGKDKRKEIAPGVIEYDDGRVIFVHGDARDFFSSRIETGDLEEPEFGDVFHFAAVVGGRLTIDGNPLAVAIDLALDALCFNWAVQAKPDRLLYASSSAAYPVDLQGEDGAVALKESDIEFGGRLGQPDMTYGWSKLTGAHRPPALRSAHRVRQAILRVRRRAGPDVSGAEYCLARCQARSTTDGLGQRVAGTRFCAH